ncbi:MAG: transposase [Bdellovibrionales bacterium]
MKQQELFRVSKKVWHGGHKQKGRRKTARPLAAKTWLHLVLKSERARGHWSFLKTQNKRVVSQVLTTQSRRFGVQIGEWVNMGNHLHLKCRFQTRKEFQNFLRTVTALIARHITGARRGMRVGRFWQGLAFTRLLRTNFEVLQLRSYFRANLLEREHSAEARTRKLKEFQHWLKLISQEKPRLKSPPKRVDCADHDRLEVRQSIF